MSKVFKVHLDKEYKVFKVFRDQLDMLQILQLKLLKHSLLLLVKQHSCLIIFQDTLKFSLMVQD
ncbi:MAG: hypothetical protein EBS89_01985 [Proteobacteria bacterium]|nr:hypothetical protein [Pseudomonadota bacterium]